MNLLYHITNLPPRMPNTEASLQELDSLRSHFGGSVIFLNPNQRSPVYLPRLLFGFHKLREIWKQEHHIQAHHLYNADPFPFPVVRYWRRPVIYSISSGVGLKRPNISFFSSLAAVTVSDERSLKRLREWGVNNSYLVRPGIESAHFSFSLLPLKSEIRVMVGSAPWTRAQFRTKGIDALLAAARQAPYLHLVCLWRGVLAEEMDRRVRRLGLEKQVEIVNKKVDVNKVLASVHASVVLVSDPAIIRSYPHTLMESLAAGKPVLVSRSIPMAEYVERESCGHVIEKVAATDILESVERLANNYETLQEAARQVGQRDFTKAALIASFRKMYEQVLGSSNGCKI